MQKQTNMKCIKLKYTDSIANKPSILFGIITEKRENFIHFRTKNNYYEINKRNVISIETTNKEFAGVKWK